MRAPTNGGTSPSSVAIPTSHGSSIRRRASLYTQNATDSQNTAAKNSDRLRITAQVPALKKSKSPLSAALIAPLRGEASRRESRRRTRGRRSPRRRSRRTQTRSASRRACPWYSLKSDVEVREQVQRSGHQDRSVRARQLAAARQRLGRIGHGFDRREEGPRPPGELRRRQRPSVPRGRGDEGVTHPRERPQHRLDLLVREDRGDNHVVAPGQPRDQPLDSGRVVRSGEHVLADELEAAGKIDLHLASERPAEKRLRGGAADVLRRD